MRPEYTRESMNRGIQGIVEVEAIVLPTGSVGAVQVIPPLDPDLDRSAIAAVKRWRFKPGTRDGKHPDARQHRIDLQTEVRSVERRDARSVGVEALA